MSEMTCLAALYSRSFKAAKIVLPQLQVTARQNVKNCLWQLTSIY